MAHRPRHQTSIFLIATACLLLMLSFGYRSSFGLFVKPITDANGWGRETIALALAIQNLFWGVVAVFAGALADRFGNTRVIVAGTLFYTLGMGLMSGIDSPWMLHASAGILVGAGIAGTSFGIVLPAMARYGIYLGRAVAIALFILIPLSLPSVMIFSAVMGFLWLATVPPNSGLVAVMFGTRYMAMLYGIVFLGHQIGSFIGVWLGGWLYDRTGTYDTIWWLGVILAVLAGIVHWPIQENAVPRLAGARR